LRRKKVSGRHVRRDDALSSIKKNLNVVFGVVIGIFAMTGGGGTNFYTFIQRIIKIKIFFGSTENVTTFKRGAIPPLL
jgi:type IV secretory pathway VirB2 component (pilin)